MSCSVAVSSSPVFPPPSPLFSNYTPGVSSKGAAVSPSSAVGFRRATADDMPSTSMATVLKRKRPAKLDIPVTGSVFGGVGETPRGAELGVVEEGRDGFYSVCCKRGRRAAMEDRFSAVVDVNGDSKQGFFGVFDGHGGAKAAEFGVENMNKNIMDEVMRRGQDDVEEAVRQGYLKTDSDFLKEDSRGGSCCVTALIRDGNLVVSNAGDCRAVLSRGGRAEALTSDHRPSREDEKQRIESMGGYVDCYNGVWRIQGTLAVSRGIGDGHLKKWVIAEPETRVHRIESDCEFLILASDGLWDKVTNQEAVDVARPLCIGTSKLEPLVTCKKLVEMAASRGSCDDISVMLIQLDQYRS
ncbi:hypothetical protein Droror1_Dr00004210 [Drosera rotundifolia]